MDQHKIIKNPPLWIWAGIPAAICIALLWIPFGFSLGGLLEEWDLIWTLNKYKGFWNSFPGNPMSDIFTVRPLTILPFYLAHAISAHSFLGFHIELIIICFLRITAATVIGRYLFNSRFYGLIFGLLSFLLPADTEHIVFRTFNSSGALALMLSSTALMLIALNKKKPILKWLTIILAIFLSITATLIYEAVFVFYLVIPLAIFTQGGFKSLKEKRAELFLWIIAPLVNFSYLVFAVISCKNTYQPNFNDILNNVHHLLDSAGYRIFYDGWISAAQILYQEIAKWPFLVTSLLILLFIVWIGANNLQRSSKSRLYVIPTGLILFAIAYLPFTVSEGHMLITQRTLMASSFGASIIIVAIISALTNNRLITTLIVTPILFIGLVAQLYQIDSYTRAYVSVKRPYMAIIANLRNPFKKNHLIIDRTGLTGHFNGMYWSNINFGTQVRLGEVGSNYILCKEELSYVPSYYGKCQLKNNVWEITDVNGLFSKISATDLDVIEIGDNFNSNYRSKDLRWHDLGYFKIENSIFKNRSGKENWYSCAADSVWGYSNFCRGEGWSDGIYVRKKLQGTKFFTPIAANTSLIFKFHPAKSEYRLQVQLFGNASRFVLPEFIITVNGFKAPFALKGENLLLANISSSMLKTGLNTIEFKNVTPNNFSTAFFMVNATLAPTRSSHLVATKGSTTQILGKDGRWIKILDKNNLWIKANSEEAFNILSAGFSAPEADGVWTDGEVAMLRFKLPSSIKKGTFIIEGAPHLNAQNQDLNIDIILAKKIVDSKKFTTPAELKVFRVPIDTKDLNKNKIVKIKLLIDKPSMPSLGDKRRLGFYVKRFKFVAN